MSRLTRHAPVSAAFGLAVAGACVWGPAHVPGAGIPPASAAEVTVPAALERRFETVCAHARRSVVTVLGQRGHESLRADASGRVRPSRSLASGVVIDARGHVVTTASAVRDCDAVSVRLADGREMPAILLGTDDAADVALLRLPVTDVPPIPLAPGNRDLVGQWVAAMGQAPGPHPRRSIGTVRRRYDRPLASYLLITNPVFPGYGGGPILTERGELAGLVVGRLAEAPADWTDASDNGGEASFALAADDLRDLVAQIERYGRVRRGFLGVTMMQGEVVDAERPGDPFKIGVRVEEVVPGGPAQQAGLRPGDLVVGWNGETLQSPEDLRRRVESSAPGTIAALVWVRGEDRQDGRLVVGARPDDELLAAPVPPTALRPAAAGVSDSMRQTRDRAELLEKVRTLRARGPAGSADTARTRPG